MIRDLLTTLGIEVKMLFASFCGGIVSVFFSKATTAFTAVGLVVTGTFTGHWLGPYAAKAVGMGDAPAAAGFLVGFLAMSVLQYASEKARSKMTTMVDGGRPNVP